MTNMDINNINRKEMVDKIKKGKEEAKTLSFNSSKDMAEYLRSLDINSLNFEKTKSREVTIDESIVYEYILIYTRDMNISLTPGDEYEFSYKGFPMSVRFISYAKKSTHTASDNVTDTRSYNSEDDKGMLYFAYDYNNMRKQNSFPYTLFRSNPNFEYELINLSQIEVKNIQTNEIINEIYNLSF